MLLISFKMFVKHLNFALQGQGYLARTTRLQTLQSCSPCKISLALSILKDKNLGLGLES